MSTVTTHVLDTLLGRPAAGVPVPLERSTGGEPVAEGLTDADERVRDLGPDDLRPGTYRVVFGTGTYPLPRLAPRSRLNVQSRLGVLGSHGDRPPHRRTARPKRH
jgi:5-hydroxyisourate hydrolase-like protein (transthyretin family)